MRRAVGGFVAAVVLCAAAPAGAVVGGTPVPDGRLRYVANISIADAGNCSGTLIAPDWVVTAGHCGSLTGAALPTPIGMPSLAIDVKLASVRTDGTGAEDHKVTRVVVDSDYLVTNGDGNDVTLLQLDRPSAVAPAHIAAVGERHIWDPGKNATIAGFGLTSENAPQPPATMQRARVPIQSDADCASAVSSFDAKTMLCAGYPQGGTDTCQGDSGGPLLAKALDGSLRVVGATSFGEGCAQAGKPGVYARLAEGPIRSFIAQVVPGAFEPEPGAKAKKKKHGRRHRKHRRHHRR
jgi:secreted trypsin-like serine protease